MPAKRCVDSLLRDQNTVEYLFVQTWVRHPSTDRRRIQFLFFPYFVPSSSSISNRQRNVCLAVDKTVYAEREIVSAAATQTSNRPLCVHIMPRRRRRRRNQNRKTLSFVCMMTLWLLALVPGLHGMFACECVCGWTSLSYPRSTKVFTETKAKKPIVAAWC